MVFEPITGSYPREILLLNSILMAVTYTPSGFLQMNLEQVRDIQVEVDLVSTLMVKIKNK